MSSLWTEATKMVVFIPIALALYYFDLSGAYQALFAPSAMAVIVASSLVLAFGLVLKWKILKESLELSQPNFAWGTLLLGVFGLLYVYGSYSADVSVFRWESFCFLALSYTTYRVGARVLKALLPLLPLFLFSYPAAFVGTAEVILLFSVETILLFLAYARMRLKLLAVPVAIVVLGLAAWVHPTITFGGISMRTWYLLPAPFLVFVSKQVRSFSSIPPARLPLLCDIHSILSNGFCSTCGRRITQPRLAEKFAPWGLVSVLGVVAILLVASVPVLAFSNNIPYDFKYAPSGFATTVTLATPAGWQVNSTQQYKYGANEPYAVEEVYVPLVHPEVKNYTMYYGVAIVPPTFPGPGGGELPGWSRVSNNFTMLGPMQGHLTVYERPGTVMLSYLGRTQMSFLSNGTFQSYYVGLGFVREFKNANIPSDVTQFMGDLNSLWVPEINNDLYYSGWTANLWTLSNGAEAVVPFVLVISSSLLIVWGAYRARLSDTRLDDFLRRGSRLSEEQWKKLVALLAMQERSSIGTRSFEGEPASQSLGTKEVEEMAWAHVVESRIVEKGNELVLTWRIAS